MSVSIGVEAPDFELPDTDGSTHSPDGDPATVVVFTCNHCPYALAWHDRIMAVARDYGDRGVRVLAINSNDAQRYPRDSYEAMKQRVATERWPLPYLRDESQEVAHAYGAQTTPDVFVLDAQRRLRYRGAPDSGYDDPSQNAAWLRGAIDAVLAGGDPSPAETKPIGCSIKWKG
ncbi:MAG: thioredoxin family protein [Actinobacteria bacterium]|jgi:peroxiredoxin|nr:MAG: thioredoxin family protein [Actinomycetota bacterium]